MRFFFFLKKKKKKKKKIDVGEIKRETEIKKEKEKEIDRHGCELNLR